MKNALFAVALGLITFNVQASLIDNGTYLTDTDTGYEWLDLNQTTNISFNDVIAQLGSGGTFDGWSLAGTTEVYSLFDAAGGNGAYGNSSGHASMRQTLLSNWAVGSTHNSPENIWFHVEDFTPGGNTTGFVLSGDSMNYYKDGFSSPGSAYSSIGTALYRTGGNTASVPEPSALLLMSLGLMGVGIVRRRKS